MANIKITASDGGYSYEAPGHFDCELTRLHDAADVSEGKVTMGISKFHPGGGTNHVPVPLESIYYLLDGQLLFKDENGVETQLKKGDSVHIAANAPKSIVNNGTEDALMLVVLEMK